MKTIEGRHTDGKFKKEIPECWAETTVAQYQNLLKVWTDEQDWIQAFSVISGLETTGIAESKDNKLAGVIYQTISYILDPNFKWDKLKITLNKVGEFEMIPLSPKVDDIPYARVKLPKNLGSMTIGQTIQARKSLEGSKNICECMSIVTAIYLQPLITKSKFDMLRVIPIEETISRMPITKIYPLGFFLLRRLNGFGKRWSFVSNLWRLWRLKRERV